MPIPEPPPDATYFRVLLLDPQGFGSSELKRLLEDCGLQVLDIEEQSRQEVNVRGGREPVRNHRQWKTTEPDNLA